MPTFAAPPGLRAQITDALATLRSARRHQPDHGPLPAAAHWACAVCTAEHHLNRLIEKIPRQPDRTTT